MTELSLVLPTIGQPDSTEDPKLNTALTKIQVWANGEVDGTNLKANTIKESNIANEAVTDAKVVKERALLSTSTSYVTKFFSEAEAKAGVEPSATRSALVTIEAPAVGLAEFHTSGGLEPRNIQGEHTYVTIFVGPKEKWFCSKGVVVLTRLI
jgi:hypothetical protein